MIPSNPSHSLYSSLHSHFNETIPAIRCSKQTLVHLSYTLESLVTAKAQSALVLVGFQYPHYWAEEAERYAEMAATAQHVYVFARQPFTLEAKPGLHGIGLQPDDPLCQEWFLLIQAPHFSVLMCGLDQQEKKPEDTQRSFSTMLSFEPEVLNHAMELLQRAVAAYRPDYAERLREAQKRFPPQPPDAQITSYLMCDLLKFEEQLNHQVWAQAEAQRQSDLKLQHAQQQILALEMENQRNQLVEQFISDVSHDLRSPITNLHSSLYLLERADTSEQRSHYIRKLHRLVTHLQRLVEDMLDLSHLSQDVRLHLKPVNLQVLLSNLVHDQEERAAERNLRLVIRLKGRNHVVAANDIYLVRALGNLLNNAIQYSPNGGIISLELVEHPEQVEIIIADPGIGINQEDLPHIFERFFRADKSRQMAQGGAGLGLAIAKKVVDFHQGRIWAESSPNTGTRFHILLPLNPSAN